MEVIIVFLPDGGIRSFRPLCGDQFQDICPARSPGTETAAATVAALCFDSVFNSDISYGKARITVETFHVLVKTLEGTNDTIYRVLFTIQLIH
jgi:hypothetical protein